MHDNTGPSHARPPRMPASGARLRAMAAQLQLARGQSERDEHDDFGIPRRLVLLGLARRSLPACDHARLVGMARAGEGCAT
jgi:hypothetical protein